MKTLLLSLLLIITALLLIGSKCEAQSKQSERDWIDSLAVTYRMAFIESAMRQNQVSLDSIEAKVDRIIFNSEPHSDFEATTNRVLADAIHKYAEERLTGNLRRYDYEKELRSVRTDFGSL